MTSNKKRRSGRPTCNSITFLLPFESNWSMVNTRLHVALFLVREIYIYIYIRISSSSLYQIFHSRHAHAVQVEKFYLRFQQQSRGQTDLEAVATKRSDEVFSIRTGTTLVASRRAQADKGTETVDWLFRLSCQSRDTV